MRTIFYFGSKFPQIVVYKDNKNSLFLRKRCSKSIQMTYHTISQYSWNMFIILSRMASRISSGPSTCTSIPRESIKLMTTVALQVFSVTSALFDCPSATLQKNSVTVHMLWVTTMLNHLSNVVEYYTYQEMGLEPKSIAANVAANIAAIMLTNDIRCKQR